MTRLVILGATGDLTGRYLLPALAQLEEHRLCDDLSVVGVAREPWDASRYRGHAREWLERAEGTDRDARARLLDRLSYKQADVMDAESLAGVFDGHPGDTLVYLALPPLLFISVFEGLRHVDRSAMRIVIEKPFGTDLGSARELNARLHELFPEPAIFRMDHFLGKQTVQNLLGLRFANRVFTPLWRSAHIEAVDIIWDETVALEGRAQYYDGTGALRDMIQNHLLQLLALVAFERPASLEAEDLRDAKVELLRRVTTPEASEIKRSVRARYGPDGGRRGYVEEAGVDPNRATETFAEVTMFIDNERWRGVPFRLRTGKALSASRREIHIHFRPVDPLPFARDDELTPNRLVLAMDPDRMVLDLVLNGAGDPFRLEPARLDLDLAPQELSAYARLLVDALEGDPSLSIRGDEAEESWRVVEPFLSAWEADLVPLTDYAAGSTGPSSSAVGAE